MREFKIGQSVYYHPRNRVLQSVLRAWLSPSHSLPIDVIQLCPVRAMTLGGAFYWLEAQPLYPSIIVRTALAENGLPFLLT